MRYKIGESVIFRREIRPFSPEWGNNLPPLETVEGIITGIEIKKKWLVTMFTNIHRYCIYVQSESKSYRLEECYVEIRESE